ncbi:prominin-1-A-like isoform X2 [Hyla sarda]|uniref:prominin-1-A-like isoform X2 n=1 Tax=Hyla sarda TaxID=327740 RepID=UPI0024C3F529|nr:prominin-1-A-like isoform X2 [Hyla sarda]
MFQHYVQTAKDINMKLNTRYLYVNNKHRIAFLEQLIKTFQFGAIDYKEVLMYEVGYLVALAIGVLFIIVMTLVGLFFACCRCCGNCGGKMYQKQTKNMNCKRRFEYLFLLIITLVILAGDICAFYSNSKINKDVKNSFTSFNNTANNLKTYVNSVPKDIDIIINSSSVPINLANSSITGIGPVLGGMIKRSIEQRANITLNTIQTTMDDLNSTAIALRAVNDSFNTLLATQQQLVQNLTTIRNQINQTLSSCSTCSPAPSVSDLTMDANFNNFPDFTNQLKTIDDFLNSGVGDSIQKARQTLNDIPQTVSNQTKTSVQQVQNQLMNIKQKIQDARNSFSVVDELDKVNSYLDMGTGNATLYEPDLVRYEYYRWIVGICLSCIILLIVVCNLFGLLLGPCGHKAHADPTERNCASNSAGDFLMAGAGFSFIFAWLLMLVTGVMFAVGGNFYTSLCKPWSNQQLYQLVDKNINISQKLNLGLSNLNLTTVYGDCAKDYSLWKTLNLSSMYDLDNYLNISQYTGEVNSTLENTNINISSITFLSAAQKDKVTNVATSGIDTFDFTDFNQQVSKNITKTSLTSFANQLDSLAAKSNSSKQTELRDEATALRNIQNSIDSLLVPQINNLSTSIAKVEEKGKALPGSLNATLASINQAQNFVNTQVAGIVKSETLQYLNTIVGYFESYITWTKTMLTQNLARCGPIASALDSAQVIACQYLVDTWNAFWFSLGWCTIFFIPSIILAVKLAKHYRRMKTSDVYENHNDHLEMTTTTSQQFLIPRVTMKS